MADKIEDRVKKSTREAIKYISNSTGANIPESVYPPVYITPGEGSAYYPENPHKIEIDTKKDWEKVRESIGEEAAHFVREYQIKSKGLPEDKAITKEFFGFLGKKIFLQKYNLPVPNRVKRKDALIASKRERLNQRRQEKLAEASRKYSGILKESMDFHFGESDKHKKGTSEEEYHTNRAMESVDKRRDTLNTIGDAEKSAKESKEKRFSYLSHARGYDFAEATDISKIDLKELYTMPDAEVRKEFFRKENGLEKTLTSIIALAGFGIGMFFLSPNLTGNAIISLTTKTSSIIGTGLFIIGIIGSYFWFKKKK